MLVNTLKMFSVTLILRERELTTVIGRNVLFLHCALILLKCQSLASSLAPLTLCSHSTSHAVQDNLSNNTTIIRLFYEVVITGIVGFLDFVHRLIF